MSVELISVSAPPLTGIVGAFGAGLHVFLGAPEDGSAALIAVTAGAIAPKLGRVAVEGRDPRSTPAVRQRIRALFQHEELVPAARVADSVRAALAFAGVPGEPSSVLAEIGLAAWAPRRTRELGPAERRSVALALALALTPANAALVTLFEPLSRVPGSDRSRVLARIQALAQSAPVLVATASVRDALALGGALRVLHRGRIVRELGAPTAAELAPVESVQLIVHCDRPRELASVLAVDAAAIAVDWNDRRAPGQLSISGTDLSLLATAIARAARTARARVSAISPTLPGVEEVRAASAGIARAAYEEAYRAAQEQARARAAAIAPPVAPAAPRQEP